MDQGFSPVDKRTNINTVDQNEERYRLSQISQGNISPNDINQLSNNDSNYITPPSSRNTNSTKNEKWPLTDPLPKYTELPNPAVSTNMSSITQSLKYLDPALDSSRRQRVNDIQVLQLQQQGDSSVPVFPNTNPNHIYNNMRYHPSVDITDLENARSHQNINIPIWQQNFSRHLPLTDVTAFNQANGDSDVQGVLDTLTGLDVPGPGLPTVGTTPVVVPPRPPKVVSPPSGTTFSRSKDSKTLKQRQLNSSPEGGDTLAAFFRNSRQNPPSTSTSTTIQSSREASSTSATPREMVEFLGLPLENSMMEEPNDSAMPIVSSNTGGVADTGTTEMSQVVPLRNQTYTNTSMTTNTYRTPNDFQLRLTRDIAAAYMDDLDTLSLYPEPQGIRDNKLEYNSSGEREADNFYNHGKPHVTTGDRLSDFPTLEPDDYRSAERSDNIRDDSNNYHQQSDIKTGALGATTSVNSKTTNKGIPLEERGSYQYIADSITDDKRKLIGVTKVDQLMLMIQARSKGITEKVKTNPNGELLIGENSRILPGKNELVGGVEKPRSRSKDAVGFGVSIPVTSKEEALLKSISKGSQNLSDVVTGQSTDISAMSNSSVTGDYFKGRSKGSKGKKLRSRHNTRARTHECFYCHRFFSQSTHLDVHLRSHVGFRPYQCQYCGKRFTQGGNLRTHQRLHTGEKPYSCDLCSKKFSRKGNLAAHMLTHQNVKPFVCKLDNCNKTFTQLGNMKAHQNKFHLKTLQDLTRRLAQFNTSLDEIPENDRYLFEYFASIYKNSNRGIKGRGKGSTRVAPPDIGSDGTRSRSGNGPVSNKSNPSNPSLDLGTSYEVPLQQQVMTSPETSNFGVKAITNTTTVDPPVSPLSTHGTHTTGNFGLNTNFPGAIVNTGKPNNNVDFGSNPVVMPIQTFEFDNADTNQALPSNLKTVGSRKNIIEVDSTTQPGPFKSLGNDTYLTDDNLDTLVNPTDEKLNYGIGMPPALSDVTKSGYSE